MVATSNIHFCCMFAYLTLDIFIDMHFGLHTKLRMLTLSVRPPPPHLPAPDPHGLTVVNHARNPSYSILFGHGSRLQIIFWHSIRHLFSSFRRCCNSKRSRHRMLHANFCWSCCRVRNTNRGSGVCVCVCVLRGSPTTFQIIYFDVSVYCLYLCDLCAKFSVFRCTTVNLNGKWKTVYYHFASTV